jgi:hypothetical protein
LRAFAAQLVPHLAPRGTPTVAITGSVARGDAGAGSDLDLWVLGPHSDRQHITVANTPVTLLRQKPRQALTLETLCLYEVGDALVLTDPRGHFAKVLRAAKTRRHEVRAEVLNATWDGLRSDLLLTDDVSHWQRILALRQASLRLAATWLYLRHGWRVPRLRALRTWLPSRERRRLDSILGLPAAPASVRRALATLGPATAAAIKLARGRRYIEPPPREISARVHAQEWDEALLLARRHLRRELLPPLMGATGFRDVVELATTPRGKIVLEAVQRCELLTKRASSVELARQVAELTVRLGFERMLPRDVCDQLIRRSP